MVKQAPTIDDVSDAGGRGPAAAPVVVLVAVGTAPERRVIAANDEVVLGRRVRAGDHGFDVDDERLSREHASVRRTGGEWRVRDLGSRNGTFVDGERITGETARRGDAVVRVGHSVFLLISDGRGHERPIADGNMVIGPELARAFDDVRAHASAPCLLVHGESGSGKELAARLYHDAGPRRGGPFVAVNCATIPQGVAERVLFGAKKGAFSGATSEAVGFLQAAHGGTLFLDEVAELDAEVQAKLLRAIETREVIPIGATSGVAVDVGIVAASHRELRAAVARRLFRDDLYYRLARAVVTLPPLRQRRTDIPRLVVRVLHDADRRLSAHARLIETCCIRPWPGNVRELQQALASAAVAARAAARDVVRPEDLAATAGLRIEDELEARSAPPPTPPTPPPTPPPSGELDRATIAAALAAAGGNVSAAARELGLHRTQLRRLMQRMGLTAPT